MPSYTKGRLKSKESGFRKWERTKETADTPQLNRKKVKDKKTSNGSFPQLSIRDISCIITDCDAVDMFNRVLLNKIKKMSQNKGSAMRNMEAAGMVTVLVLGMVFMSGCVSPSSTSTTPAVSTPSPIVDETVPVSSFPTSATDVLPGTVLVPPTPEQIVHENMSESPAPTLATAVFTANETGNNESQSKDNNRNTPLFVETETTGGLFININRGGSVDGLKVFIAREGTSISPIEYAFLPDRTVVEGENRGYLQVRVPPDGRSDLIKLQPGNYTAYLPDWNNGEPEQQSFTIQKEDITPIWFEGFSASGGGCGC